MVTKASFERNFFTLYVHHVSMNLRLRFQLYLLSPTVSLWELQTQFILLKKYDVGH